MKDLSKDDKKIIDNLNRQGSDLARRLRDQQEYIDSEVIAKRLSVQYQADDEMKTLSLKQFIELKIEDIDHIIKKKVLPLSKTVHSI